MSDALRVAERAVTAAPFEAIFSFKLAFLLARTDDIAAASRAMEIALVIDPGSHEARAWLGVFSAILERYDEAVDCFEGVYWRRPDFYANNPDILAVWIRAREELS
jgi:Flp pilus assembly protein TadD